MISQRNFRSRDDLDSGALAGKSNINQIQRPRSVSPVKRYSLPSSFFDKNLPILPSDNECGLKLSASSSFDALKWKEITKSPVAKKLHIADVGESRKYTIPIPFTLQLPPKLSAKNIEPELKHGKSPEIISGSTTPKQTFLVYNGNGYEKLDNDEQEYNQAPESPTPKSRKNKSPRRLAPPPVALNKSPKSPKKVKKIIDADELSIIEERNSELSTRKSSLKINRSGSIKPTRLEFRPVQEATPESENDELIEFFPVHRANSITDLITSEFFPSDTNVHLLNNHNQQKIVHKELDSTNKQYLKTGKLEFKSIGIPPETKDNSSTSPILGLINKYTKENEVHQSVLSPEYSGELYTTSFDTSNDSGFTKPLKLNHDDTTPRKEKKLLPLISNFSFLDGTLKKLTNSKKSLLNHYNQNADTSESNGSYRMNNSNHSSENMFNSENNESHQTPIFSKLTNNNEKDGLSLKASKSKELEGFPESAEERFQNNLQTNDEIYSHSPQKAASSLSINSNVSNNTSGSWDSLQKSVDITSWDQTYGSKNASNNDIDLTVTRKLSCLSKSGSDWEDNVSATNSESNIQLSPLRSNKQKAEFLKDSSCEERYFEDSVIATYFNPENDSSYVSEQVSQILEEDSEDSSTTRIEDEFEFREEVSKNKICLEELNEHKMPSKTMDIPGLDMQQDVVIRQNTVDDFHDLNVLTFNLKNLYDENYVINKSFYFPNDSSNITNSKEIKSRSFGSIKSKVSRMSFLSANGQIEIPDLTEDSISGSYTTKASYVSHNGTTFDDVGTESSVSTAADLEPIGYPCTEARKAFREHMLEVNEYSAESNDEYEASNSGFAATRSKSVPDLQYEQAKPLVPLSISRSPARHGRHKSLHNINFDANAFLKNKELPKVPTETNLQNNHKPLEQIVVSPPPVQVNYAVDFVEASPCLHTNTHTRSKLLGKAEEAMESLSQQLQETSIKRHSIHVPRSSSRKTLSETSKSSYQSSHLSRQDPPSSVSDQDDVASVLVDLTKEKYDITTIHRSNSTHSYRSVIEKTKEGKEVEVVLLDDDEDLLSIYSKYRRMKVLRSGSIQSSLGSEVSTTLYNSIASSKQLSLKPSTYASNFEKSGSNLVHSIANRRYGNSLYSNSSTSSSNYKSKRIQPPASIKVHSSKKFVQRDHSKRHTINFDAEYFNY